MFWTFKLFSLSDFKYNVGYQGYNSDFYIIELFGYCKGGTSWMRKEDWSTLYMGKSWKRGVILFEGNCIIVP